MFISKKGFTLIELLVVIAIIALLSSIVLASLSSARVKARDSARIAELKEMEKALEMYFNDYGRYPGPGSPASIPSTGYFIVTPYQGAECGYLNDWCTLETALRPYLKSLPRDIPYGTGNGQRWIYKNPYQNTGIYGLGVYLENPNSISINDGGYQTVMFEVGSLVPFCMNKYTGTDRLWYTWDSSKMCVGGN